MKEKIREILKNIQPDYEFEPGVNFIEEGYLDSMDVVQVIEALEEEFSISISALDLRSNNFISIEAMIDLVNRSKKRKA